jgi:hypothetical protein
MQHNLFTKQMQIYKNKPVSGCAGAFKIVAIKRVNLENQIKIAMTESTFMALAQKRYAELQALNKINSFYDYEKEFDKIWRELGREVLEANISEVPDNRRKKKHLPNTGR